MRLGLPEVLVILFIILLIFGANRVPSPPRRRPSPSPESEVR